MQHLAILTGREVVVLVDSVDEAEMVATPVVEEAGVVDGEDLVVVMAVDEEDLMAAVVAEISEEDAGEAVEVVVEDEEDLMAEMEEETLEVDVEEVAEVVDEEAVDEEVVDEMVVVDGEAVEEEAAVVVVVLHQKAHMATWKFVQMIGYANVATTILLFAKNAILVTLLVRLVADHLAATGWETLLVDLQWVVEEDPCVPHPIFKIVTDLIEALNT